MMMTYKKRPLENGQAISYEEAFAMYQALGLTNPYGVSYRNETSSLTYKSQTLWRRLVRKGFAERIGKTEKFIVTKKGIEELKIHYQFHRDIKDFNGVNLQWKQEIEDEITRHSKLTSIIWGQEIPDDELS